MRNGGHILNQLDSHASRLQRGNCAFASGAGSLDPYFDFLHAELRRLLSRLLSGYLACERSALAASLETTGTGTGPAQGVTLGVGNGNRRIVERRADVRHCHRYVTTLFATFYFRHLEPLQPKNLYLWGVVERGELAAMVSFGQRGELAAQLELFKTVDNQGQSNPYE